MMPAIHGVMLAAGSSLAALIVVKATVVAALGLAAAWLARGSRAAVRHALLAVTFGAMLLLPIASLVAPPVHVTVPVAEVSPGTLPLWIDALDPIPPITAAADRVRPTPAPPQASGFSLSVLLLAGWILGTVIFLLPVVNGLWQIRSLRRSGLPWVDGQSIAEALALEAGIHRHVEVLLHESLPGPITCGVLHPAVVLPRDAENWVREDLGRAIVHELEHVRRGDSATRYLARAACALYWFHPLAWIAWRKLVLEAERSCDDAVLRRSEATAYADQLVKLANRLPTAQRSPLLAMASRSDLSTRVGAVLDSRQRRGRAGTFSLALACAAAVVLVLVMSPLMLVASPQAAPTQKWEAVSIRPCESRDSADRKEGGGPTPGRLNLNCFTVVMLIEQAYEFFGNSRMIIASHFPPIEGGPPWIKSDRYRINAKAEGTPRYEVINGPMLQKILEDRFNLKIHRETREIPVYALTVAKGGPKLQPSKDGNCIPIDLTTPAPAQPSRGLPQVCGLSSIGMPKGSNLAEDFHRVSITEFSQQLNLDRPIIDKTGITGLFDIHLEFALDDTTRAVLPSNRPGTVYPEDPTGGTSIFTAVQEQLGLKLESTKGPGEFIVIDHVEKPSEN